MYLQIFNTQNCILFKISAWSLFLTVFLNFCIFKPRYSYKTYSYNKVYLTVQEVRISLLQFRLRPTDTIVASSEYWSLFCNLQPRAFNFQPIRHKYAIFSFEFIKVWRLSRLRHDLSTHVESARIEASDQIPQPLRVVIKFPSSRAWKGVKCPGYARGVDVGASIWLIHKI